MNAHKRSPLHLNMEPTPGADIADCFDQALDLTRRLDCTVNWSFNEVLCGVRPCDDALDKEVFLRNYHRELVKTTGCKICYANP